jgi:hypothetical protein
MRDPAQPDTQRDQYIADKPKAHKNPTANKEPDAIDPRDPSSMPRSEDDARTGALSPEFHDRTDVPDGGTATPPPPNEIRR